MSARGKELPSPSGGAQTPPPSHRLLASCAASSGRSGGRDDRLPRHSPRAASARVGDGAHPLQPRRAALAWARLGAVPNPRALRPLERLGSCGARGRGPARCADERAGTAGLVAARQPVVGRTVGPDRLPTPRQGDQAARLLRLEPDARRAGTHAPAGRAPAIIPRSGWNADEKIRRATPSFAPVLRLALVHHTAGANGYTAAQSPAIVRAIELYHVKGNGWNDIGYNFLVDRFGKVFEGRYGGDRPERRRRARGGVQHRLGRGRGAGRVQLAAGRGEGAGRACAAARVAARPRARRSCDDAVVPFGRQRSLPGRSAGLPAHGLRPPGHGLHRLPGERPVRHAQRHHGRRRGVGLPKLYAPVVTGAVPGTFASGRGSRPRCRGRSRSTTRPGVAPTSGPAERRLDLGCDRSSRAGSTPTRSPPRDVTPAVGSIGGAGGAEGSPSPASRPTPRRCRRTTTMSPMRRRSRTR